MRHVKFELGARPGVRRALVFSATVFVLASATGARADNPIFGTVQANGPAWSASDSSDWQRIVTTRPLVAGDGLRTGDGGYMLLDLGAHGIVGLYDDTQVAAVGDGQGPSIDVSGGKLAFHIEAKSMLTISAADAEILAPREGAASVDGYVEINDNGDAVVAVEKGELAVAVGGTTRKLVQGERMLLNQMSLGSTEEQLRPASTAAASAEPVAHKQMASNHVEGARRDKAAGITEDNDDAEAAVINATNDSGEMFLGFTHETGSVAALGAVASFLAIDHYQDDTEGSP